MTAPTAAPPTRRPLETAPAMAQTTRRRSFSVQSLARRLAHHDARWLTGAMFLIATMVALVTVAAISSSAITQAAVDTIQVQNAGRDVRLSAQSGAAIPDDLFQSGLAAPVQFDTAQLQGDQQLATAQRVLTRPVDEVTFGALVAGRPPAAVGEAAVSITAASSMNAGIGDRVSVDGEPVTVVGIFALPTFADQITVHVVGDVVDPTEFFADRDVMGISAVTVGLADGSLRLRSVESLAFQELSQESSAVQQIKWVWYPATLLASLLVVAWLTSQWVRRHRAATKSLVQLGMSGAAATRVPGLVWTIALLTASLAGVGGGWLLADLTRLRISGLLDQYWLATPLPLLPLGQAAAAILIVGYASAQLRARVAPPRSLSSARTALAAVVVVAAAVALWTQKVSGALASFALSAILVGGTCAVMAASQGGVISRKATSRWYAGRRLNYFGAAAAGAIVLFAGSTFSGFWGQLAWEERAGYQSGFDYLPPGSLQVESIGAGGASELSERYRALGGQSRIYDRVDDGALQFRATTGAIGECLARRVPVPVAVLPECAAEANSPIALGMVGASSSGANDFSSDTQTYAQPSLIDGNGRVAIVSISDERDEIIDVQLIDALPSATLSTVNVIAVVPSNSAAFSEIGLHSNGTQTISLLGVAEMNADAQAEVRYLASTLAASSVVNEDPGPNDKAMRSLSQAAAVTTTLAALLIMGSLIRLAESGDHALRGVTRAVSTQRLLYREAVGMYLPVSIAVGCGTVAAALFLHNMSMAPLPRVMYLPLTVSILVGPMMWAARAWKN